MAMFNFRLTQSEPQVWKDVWNLLQIVICLQTNHQLVLKNSFKNVRSFQIKFEFESVDYWGDGKDGVPGEKPLGARGRTNNKLNPHDTDDGIWTRATLVRSQFSHHCSTLAPYNEISFRKPSLLVIIIPSVFECSLFATEHDPDHSRP